MPANSKSTCRGKLQVPFLNIHTGFNRAFRFCTPLAKHRKFPALVFMNKQIQKGKKRQQICIYIQQRTSSTSSRCPSPSSGAGRLVVALLNLAPSLSIPGDPFGYRLHFTSREWSNISADSSTSLLPGDWLRGWDVLLMTSGGKREALQTHYLHQKWPRKKAGSLVSYQESGCSLAGDGFLPSTEFPLSASSHDIELIEQMQSRSQCHQRLAGGCKELSLPASQVLALQECPCSTVFYFTTSPALSLYAFLALNTPFMKFNLFLISRTLCTR